MSENVDVILRLRGEREFTAGTAKAATGVGRVGRATEAAGKQAKVSTGLTRKFGSALSAVGRAARTGAAIGIGAAGAEAIKATKGWADHLEITKRTRAVVKSTGGAANVTAKHVGKLSDAIERQTGVDGDLVQGGANLLLTFTNVRNGAGKNNKIFDKATTTITSMSKALGQDTKSSAIQLGKALNDPTKGITALSRVGVSFTKDQKKTIATLVKHNKSMEAQKIILKELGKEFPKVKPTPLQLLQVEVRKLEDALGKQLLPVFNRGVKVLTKFLQEMQNGTGQGGKFVKFVTHLRGEAEAAWPKIRKFVQGIDFGKAKKTADDLKGPLGKVWTVVSKLAGNSGVQKAALAIGAFGGAAVLANKATGGLAGEMVKTSRAGIGMITSFANLAASVIGYKTAQMASTTQTNLATAAQGRSKVMTILASGAQKVAAAATWLFTIAQKALNLAMRMNPIGLIITGVILLVGAVILAYKKVGWFRAAVNKVWDVLKSVAGFLANQAVEAWHKLTGALKSIPFGWVKDKFMAMLNFIKGLPGRITKAASGMWDGFKNAFKSVINWIIDAWNGLHFGIPGFNPPGPGKFPGFRVGVPQIPHVATGGIVAAGGAAMVGERGPEMVTLPRAAEVIPNHALANAAGRTTTVVSKVYLDRRQIAEAVGEHTSDRMARR